MWDLGVRQGGNTPLVARFMKVARRLRSVSKKLASSQDLSVVLDALCQQPFETLDQVDLKMLSFKTALLLELEHQRLHMLCPVSTHLHGQD